MKWIDRLLDKFPTVSSYLLDLEKPINFKGIKGMIMTGKLKKMIPESRVKDKLNSIVDSIHDHGKKVVSTSYGGYPLGLQPRPNNADYYSYMAYLSFYLRFSDIPTRRAIIFYVANKIRKEHGQDKAAIDLGVTYAGVISAGLINAFGVLSINEIIREMEICLYAKLKRIQIFALDNLTKDIDSTLERITSAKPTKPPQITGEKTGFMLKAYRKVLFPRDRDLSKF